MLVTISTRMILTYKLKLVLSFHNNYKKKLRLRQKEMVLYKFYLWKKVNRNTLPVSLYIKLGIS